MFCKNWGKEIPDDKEFCSNCGWKKGTSEVKQKSKIKVILPIVLLIIGVVLVKVIFFGGTKITKEYAYRNLQVSGDYDFNSGKLFARAHCPDHKKLKGVEIKVRVFPKGSFNGSFEDFVLKFEKDGWNYSEKVPYKLSSTKDMSWDIISIKGKRKD